MKTQLFYIIVLAGLICTFTHAAFQDRSEIKKYSLYRDRLYTDKLLTKEVYKNFFEFDLFYSKGVKTLISEVKEAMDSSNNPLLKQLNVMEVLSKNINTEKLVDIGVTFGTPLPYIKINEHRLLPGFFADFNAGTLVSIDNRVDPTDPRANIYLKKDIKYGLNSRYKTNQNNDAFDFSIYKLSRSDLETSKTASQIISEDSFIDLDSLTKDEKVIAADLKYMQTLGNSAYLYEIREFKLHTLSGSQESSYGTKPYLRFEFDRLFNETYGLSFFIGEHFRQRYKFQNGLYLGIRMRSLEKPPIAFIFKFDADFLTFIPELKTKWLIANYKLIIPHSNPQDEIWASTIHSISLNIPFP
ncbi:MAG: hypothetical protein A2381_14940 [Bdellovibrionales bacterium RIFOXYB1_FULL_37_110]|nr:MAG: hypothetical protein A2417_10445 [Bdellovibrionales bacterium RIFOXYC1_FULL_37_79]OFZ60161.1 MAG: hypothetical protein A2381_14940 [Bdellovibrionales bacterium RIFOXYB1_FULL_37_110]OFZ64345.1 MAG: hypothetical protein A2577_09830 [Bdellovibrionales bacterium RIFOXYD1_FULL_36_51]